VPEGPLTRSGVIAALVAAVLEASVSRGAARELPDFGSGDALDVTRVTIIRAGGEKIGG
jgi:hypothetical protein